LGKGGTGAKKANNKATEFHVIAMDWFTA